jgi:large subunit ribosomal protein L13
MKTRFRTNEESLAKRGWVLIDASGQAVGRLSSKIAAILRGKNNPSFATHNDSGDFVVVINAAKIVFTGKKAENECYYRHSGFVGGIKSKNKGELLASHPELVLKHAVKGMLPHTSLGRRQLTKLKVYNGAEHPHTAQQPKVINL